MQKNGKYPEIPGGHCKIEWVFREVPKNQYT